MQLLLPLYDLTPLLEKIDRRLRVRFSQPGPWYRLDPLSQLVLGLVGGRTYGAVSLRAFEALIRRFEGWDRVRDARTREVYEAIRAVTYADVKARRLKASLEAITAMRGGMSLDFLHARSVDEALMWLERLPGVGRKTSAATLNFSTLEMRALVIDTHHARVLRRLGIVGARSELHHAYNRVMAGVPPQWDAKRLDDHHQLMKRLGQEICRHARPACPACPLDDLCLTAGKSPHFQPLAREDTSPRAWGSPGARTMR